jgi:hypothetical protein
MGKKFFIDNNYMKKLLLIISSLFVLLPIMATEEQQLAFPTAEGFGRFATGGRMTDPAIGANVYYVTRLDDCTDVNLVEGTLRWALRTGDDTPRTILFKVGGTIKLTSKLKFAHPNVSILGQSAPGGGICISGANIYVCKNNVIIRYVRFRAGDEANSNYSALDIENIQNCIIDHCSFSWSMEENVTMYDNKYTTMQWCILSEPLYYSRHKKGERGYGAQWGGEHSSYHHNLFAHCVGRVPQINGVNSDKTSGHDFYVDEEIVNNVIYNAKSGEATYNGRLIAANNPDAYVNINHYKNYYKPGPVTLRSGSSNRLFCVIYNGGCTGVSKWFIDGNKYETNSYSGSINHDNDGVNQNNWKDYGTSSGGIKFKTSIPDTLTWESYKLNEPSVNSGIKTTSADIAYSDVIAKAGCRLPVLDEVDARILAEAAGEQEPLIKSSITGKTYCGVLGVVNSQNDLKPENADATWSAWPDLSAFVDENEIVDTDVDGLPDNYDDANGLNKNDAADGRAIAENGYSNLENYMNSLENALVAPQNLVGKRTENSIALTWQDKCKDETGFILERAEVGEADLNFESVATLSANETSFIDNAVSEDKKYIYRLRSVRNLEESKNIRTTVYPIKGAGVQNVEKTLNFTISPNPTKDFVKISSEENLDKISLFTSSGILLDEQVVTGQSCEFSLSSVAKGVYVLVVKSEDGDLSTTKIIKE